MNKKVLVIIIGLVFTVLGIGYLYQTVPKSVKTVVMKGPSGQELGTIRLSETKAGVLLSLDLKGLTPNGEQAIHIHETGLCEASFKTAGGHYNPTAHAHGMKHPKGHHAGDMPNLRPDDNGEIKTQILNRKITLANNSTDTRATIYDVDGSAIIIHEGADDHMSQPSGAAGSRIACGIIPQ